MGRFAWIFYFLRNLFALIGVAACVAGVLGLKIVLDRYQLTPNQFAVKVAHKAGIDSPLITRYLTPSPQHEDHNLIGTLHNGFRPRLVVTGEEGIRRLRDRYQKDTDYRSSVDALARSSSYLAKAVAWACGGDDNTGRYGIRQLQNVGVRSVSASGSYGNGLNIALAYDLLAAHPGWKSEERKNVNRKLRRFLRDALTVLDGGSASLWHGRMQLSSSAWVAAAALDKTGETDRELVTRVQAHFLESLDSIALTEGWPEGYNYWINNRAFPFALACLAHLNAVDAPELNDRIRKVIGRVGRWMISGTEPQGRFHLFGDTGPRNDLKDETQRVIDLIYLATGDKTFKRYSEYLSGLHGREAYYRGYRWGVPLFRGPVRDFSPAPSPKLDALKGSLPVADIFGREAFGQVFMRSGWGREDTFISFKSGHTFTHHGHYQAGHFTVNKAGEPLAITSGTYGGWNAPHRLHYYLRTVAANSLLILKPGEKVKPNRFFELNVSGGGQRVVMPTGSAVESVEDWRRNLNAGRHYEGGKITAYEYQPEAFVYTASDMTRAYNSVYYDENGAGGKVREVARSLVYLPQEDALVVYDKVIAVSGKFAKKWLLHTAAKPESKEEKVLVGDRENGILESTGKQFRVQGSKSELMVQRLLPDNGVVRKVGGRDYRYYVETDGDDSTLDGLNMDIGAKEKPWFDSGLWRLEIQPEKGRKEDHFLVALFPRLKGGRDVPETSLIEGQGVEGARLGSKLLLFKSQKDELQSFSYTLESYQNRHMVFGVVRDADYQVSCADRTRVVRSTGEGVLSYELSDSDTHQGIAVTVKRIQ